MSEPALVFLPKYSPDLNPIEQVFAKFSRPCCERSGAQKITKLHLRRLRPNPRPILARRMRRIPQKRRIRVDPKAGRLSYDFSRREGEKDRWERVAALSSAAEGRIGKVLTV